MQRPCGHREHTAEQGNQGLNETGEVKGTGPRPENNGGAIQGLQSGQ